MALRPRIPQCPTRSLSHLDHSHLVGTPPEFRTWRVFAVFDEPYDRVLAVDADIVGSYWREDGPAGWFDSNPGPLPGFLYGTLLAQFTVRSPYGVRLSGVISFNPGSVPPAVSVPFCAVSEDYSPGPCAPDLDRDDSSANHTTGKHDGRRPKKTPDPFSFTAPKGLPTPLPSP